VLRGAAAGPGCHEAAHPGPPPCGFAARPGASGTRRNARTILAPHSASWACFIKHTGGWLGAARGRPGRPGARRRHSRRHRHHGPQRYVLFLAKGCAGTQHALLSAACAVQPIHAFCCSEFRNAHRAGWRALPSLPRRRLQGPLSPPGPAWAPGARVRSEEALPGGGLLRAGGERPAGAACGRHCLVRQQRQQQARRRCAARACRPRPRERRAAAAWRPPSHGRCRLAWPSSRPPGCPGARLAPRHMGRCARERAGKSSRRQGAGAMLHAQRAPSRDKGGSGACAGAHRRAQTRAAAC